MARLTQCAYVRDAIEQLHISLVWYYVVSNRVVWVLRVVGYTYTTYGAYVVVSCEHSLSKGEPCRRLIERPPSFRLWRSIVGTGHGFYSVFDGGTGFEPDPTCG